MDPGTLPCEVPTPDAFRTFGALLAVPDQPPERTSGPRRAGIWPLADLEFLHHAPYVATVRYEHRPLRCDSLQRHPGETQFFVPIGGSASVIVVAPGHPDGDRPDPDAVRAFLLDGSAGVLFGRDTWARHFYPLGPHSDYVVVTARRQSGDDVVEAALPRPLEIILPEAWADRQAR